MPAVLFEIDPVSEDATNVALSLTDTTIRLFGADAMDLTPPDIEPIYASSADTEGDPFVGSRPRNRTIALKFLAKTTTDALLQTAIYGVQQKVDKLRREGGTLKYTTQAGTEIVFDVEYARFNPEFRTEYYVLNKAMQFTLEFECKPYGRGAPVQQSDHVETTLPCLVFTDASIGGDVPALGKLIVDEDQAADQLWLVWGVQSRYYDAAATAALFYEAEGCTALGGSATAVGPSGASGAGSNVMRNTGLTSSYQAILSSQATGGGSHWSHIGDFRVFARVQVPTTNTGAVSVALEWGEGDFLNFSRNVDVAFPVDVWDGTWRLVDLGQVHLSKVAQGTQRWEARILAKSTVAGDDIDVDYMMLVPVSEGSGEVSAVPLAQTPTSFSARDEFDQSDGALTGKTLPVGGTWAGAGDADDWTVSNSFDHVIVRQASSDADANTGRYAIAGTATFTNVIVRAKIRIASAVVAANYIGVVARYTDTNNWVMADITGTNIPTTSTNMWTLEVRKRVAGTVTSLGSIRTSYQQMDNVTAGGNTISAELRLLVDAAGRFFVWLGGTLYLSGYDAALATAGALATGKAGVYNANLGTAVGVTALDDFWVAVPVIDAAVYASQSLEIRHDRVLRENSGGTVWNQISPEGDHLRVPAAGKEGRSARFIVKACRNDPTTMADTAIDDISGRLTVTPRYLVLPS